jgi:ribosomal protein S11
LACTIYSSHNKSDKQTHIKEHIMPIPRFFINAKTSRKLRRASVRMMLATDARRKLRGVPRLLALTALVAAANASAAGPTHVMVHVASAHTEANFNNTNLGLGLRWADAQGDGPVAGVYGNSEWRNSAYAGYAWSWQVAGPVSAQLAVGAVTGYKLAAVVPMVLPSLAYAITPKAAIRISAVPPVGKMAGVAHLSVEFKL